MTTLVPGQLWTDDQPLKLAGLDVRRRMAVARGADGRNVVFSPVAHSDQGLAALRSLGPISAFVVPSRWHILYYDGYFDRVPEARFLAGSGVKEDQPEWPLQAFDPADPALAGFRFKLLGGMPALEEYWFLHESTHTLFVGDALFNLTPPAGWWPRVVMRLAGFRQPPAPSIVFRSIVKQPAALGASVAEVLTWDFDRIVGGHGAVMERDGREIVRQAFAKYLNI